MIDATQYKATVNWQALIKSSAKLTNETLTNPATFRIKVYPTNLSEPGAQLPILIGFYIQDYFKNRFKVITVNGFTLDVEDSFRCENNPQVGLSARVYKSVDFGAAPFVFPTIDSDILYKTREAIDFTANATPSLPTPADIIAGETFATKYASRYGQRPNFMIWVANGGNWLPRPELQPIITTVDGLITGDILSVNWDLDDEYTGIIIISR